MSSMTEVWMLLKCMYPNAMDRYGDVDGGIFRFWEQEVLPEQIAAGVSALRNRTSPFPPSLPEFKTMCGALHELPKNDEEMRQWAIANGYGDARGTESWAQYRGRVESAHNRASSPTALPAARKMLS